MRAFLIAFSLMLTVGTASADKVWIQSVERHESGPKWRSTLNFRTGNWAQEELQKRLTSAALSHGIDEFRFERGSMTTGWGTLLMSLPAKKHAAFMRSVSSIVDDMNRPSESSTERGSRGNEGWRWSD